MTLEEELRLKPLFAVIFGANGNQKK